MMWDHLGQNKNQKQTVNMKVTLSKFNELTEIFVGVLHCCCVKITPVIAQAVVEM